MSWIDDLLDRLLGRKPTVPVEPTVPWEETDEYKALVRAVDSDCTALWKDELKRVPNDFELHDCRSQILSHAADIEKWRAHLRTTDEYKTLQGPVKPTNSIPVPLIASGRLLMKQGGGLFQWNGITAFRLLKMIAEGKESEAANFMDWSAKNDVTILRVLSMAKWLFELRPEDGREAIPTLLKMANDYGRYIELVALADTKSYPTQDIRAHVSAVGTKIAGHPNLVVEIGNELSPVHETQRDVLGDVGFLKELRGLLPRSIPVSLGSTHASEDESSIFADGDFLTVHGSRDAGGDGWRWPRHTNEQRALADRERKFAVNDEPAKDMAVDKQLGVALLCRLATIGDTFHYQGGLQALIPAGDELAAFNARRQGWNQILTGWTGSYRNAGQAGSPVKAPPEDGFKGGSENTRFYSFINGGEGYTIGLACEHAEPEWNWSSRTLLMNLGGTRLYAVRN